MKKSQKIKLATCILGGALAMCSVVGCRKTKTPSSSDSTTTPTSDVSSETQGTTSDVGISETSTSTELLEFTGVEFKNVTVTYDGEPHTIVADKLPDGTAVTYIGTDKYTDAGTYEIKVKLTKEGYNDKELKATLTINKATYDMSGVTLGNKTVTYNGSAHAVELTGDLPEGVTSEIKYYSDEAHTTEVKTPTNAGTYYAVASFASTNTNYNAIDSKTATLTINKATIDVSGVTAPNQTVVATGNVINYSPECNLNTVNVVVEYYTDEAHTNKVDAPSSVGVYYVVVGFTPKDSVNYQEIATKLNARFEIRENKTGIVISEKTVVYNGLAQTIAVDDTNKQTDGDFEVNYYSDSTCITPFVNPTNTGEYPVYAKIVDKNGIYNDSILSSRLIISKAELTCTVDSKAIDYNQNAPEFTYSFSDTVNGENIADVVNTSGLAWQCTYAKGSNVGTYPIVASGLVADNYNITYVDGVLTVNKIDYVATGLSLDPVDYNGQEYSININGLGENLTFKSVEYFEDPECTLKLDSVKDAGTYYAVVTLNQTIDTVNYNATTTVKLELNINKKTVTIEWSNLSQEWTGDKLMPTASFTAEQGVVTGDEVNITLSTASDPIAIGSYDVTASIEGADINNYELDTTTAKTKLTIVENSHGSEDNYLNVDEALHSVSWIGKDKFTTKMVYVTGVVTDSVYNETYGSYTLWLSSVDGANQKAFQIYSANLSSDISANIENIQVGDTVNAYGYLKYYNGETYELASKTVTGGSKVYPTITAVSRDIESFVVVSDTGSVSSLCEVNDTINLIAKCEQINAVVDETKISWSSTNESVASVTTDGVVTANAVGTATIKMAYDGVEMASYEVTVSDSVVPVESVEIVNPNINAENILYVDRETGTISLSATVSPADATSKTVTWTSSSPDVATIDENGTITVLKLGTTTITATAGGVSKEITLKVSLGTLTVPMTVEETLTYMAGFANKQYSEGMAFVSGYVISNSGKNIVIADSMDSSNTFTIYDSTPKTGVEAPIVGDLIVASGYLYLYNSTYEIKGQGDVTAYVESSAHQTYNITSTIENGTINNLPSSGLNGSNISFTVTPNDGYKIKSVKVNNVEVTATDGTYSFVIVKDMNVSVEIVTNDTKDIVEIYRQDLTNNDRTSGNNDYMNPHVYQTTDDNVTWTLDNSSSAGTDLITTSGNSLFRTRMYKNKTGTTTIISSSLISSEMYIDSISFDHLTKSGVTLNVYYSLDNGTTWVAAAESVGASSSLTTYNIENIGVTTSSLCIKFEYSVTTSTVSNRDNDIDNIVIKGYNI